MRRSLMGLMTFALVVTGLSLAAPAYAQDAPKVEVSGGWQYLRQFDKELDDSEKNLTKGWYGDISGNITPTFGIVAEVFGAYKKFDLEDVDFSLHGVMFGGRVQSRASANVVPFAQVLGGWARSKVSASGFEDSENDGALQVGGGVNLMANRNIGARVGADYIRVFTPDQGTNLFRLGVGVVIGF